MKLAEEFMHCKLMFRSLSHYLFEDNKVRGDIAEGMVSLKPKGGLVIHNKTQGKDFVIPEGSFNSSVNTEEIFILCASASASDELRDRFNAKAVVEIKRVATFCARIQTALPPAATFCAQRVTYYSPTDELGAKWAFPDMIAFTKSNDYKWQDEYRFCFSLSSVLTYGQTKQQVMIPNQIPGPALPPPPPVPRSYPLTINALHDICELTTW